MHKPVSKINIVIVLSYCFDMICSTATGILIKCHNSILSSVNSLSHLSPGEQFNNHLQSHNGSYSLVSDSQNNCLVSTMHLVTVCPASCESYACSTGTMQILSSKIIKLTHTHENSNFYSFLIKEKENPILLPNFPSVPIFLRYPHQI